MIKILFVCMGNICRSPTAEGVFRHLLRQRGLEREIEVDSAGTHGYHAGEPPDARTQRAAAGRGYDLSNLRARKAAPQDLEYFDMILAMDRNNLEALRRMCPTSHHARIEPFMQYARSFDDTEVPDPYYSLGHSFDLVLDMIEDASKGLLEAVCKQLPPKENGKSPSISSHPEDLPQPTRSQLR
ncbi:MAG: low molecular weight phosphotyrosine protein phosphatase [Betaproteobacteria bacterium]|nr:low molecular weight phosphotyrosine protein phosphatase [Betaproteobacteria bacterium]